MNSNSQMIGEPVLQTLQARMGMRIASALSERSSALPHDITERLRFARELAMSKAHPAQQAANGATPVGRTAGGSLLMGAFVPWWQRALGILPLVLLLSGLMLIQQWSAREQMMAAADIDAVLLADDLPPAAYSDPGFGEYLRTANP
jgi:hypothetical protein